VLLCRLADDFERHSNESLADPERYIGNPVNAYLLVKRFTSDWEQVVNTQIRSSSAEGLLSVHIAQHTLTHSTRTIRCFAALLAVQDADCTPATINL